MEHEMNELATKSLEFKNTINLFWRSAKIRYAKLKTVWEAFGLVVYMNCSQHRLNTNNRLNRTSTVVRLLYIVGIVKLFGNILCLTFNRFTFVSRLFSLYYAFPFDRTFHFVVRSFVYTFNGDCWLCILYNV